MSKIYLGISTDEKEYDNIKDLTSVWKHFDGLAVTFHGSKDSDAYKLILERIKDGFVECRDYWGEHSYDLNAILFNPILKLGDWILLRDSAERINESFASNIRPFIRLLDNQKINTAYQRSKLLLFRKFPHQEFSGTPHWGFRNPQPEMISIEKQSWFKDDNEYCYSVRDERPQFHWIDSYLRYYLLPNSNHNLLGAEHFGNPSEVFIQKENIRMQFLLYLQSIGVNNTIDDIINYWKNNELTIEMRLFISNVRILNDAYLYHVIGRTDLTDDIVRPSIEIP